jgi:alanine dehydrogenase
VRELTSHGHQVLVQTGAGAAIGLSDEQYKAAGATLAADAKEIFAKAEMIVKVKEPQPQECAMLRAGQILYTYLHLAPDPEQTAALVKSGAVCIAYETITGPGGGLPLKNPKAAWAFFWAACRVCQRPMWPSLVPASLAPMPCKWPSAWARASPCWTRA